MTPTQLQYYLCSFINHEIHLDASKRSSFKIERVQKLLEELGNPQKNLKIIHVAGSKGKGSVCAITANILKDAGYRVGLYTSPHMNSFRERIRILNPVPAPESNLRLGETYLDVFDDMISDDDLGAVVNKIQLTIDLMRFDPRLGRLSFFEVFTVIALYYFSKKNVDIVVLETGLGGRLDATNAVESIIAAIAPISLEHTAILGTDIRQIAREKAAIIKDSEQKVVIAPQDKQVQDELEKRCAQQFIVPLWVEQHVRCDVYDQNLEYQEFDLTTQRARYKIVSPLLGKHQRDNCAVAVGIIEALAEFRFQVPAKAVETGIKNIFWPGRFEVISRHPHIILDGAHNKASVCALIDLIKELFGDQKITLVLGISQDKDVTAICEEFDQVIKHTIFVKADHPRAQNLPGAMSVKKAMELVSRKCTKDDIVLVTGSLFVVSEARAILKSEIEAV